MNRFIEPMLTQHFQRVLSKYWRRTPESARRFGKLHRESECADFPGCRVRLRDSANGTAPEFGFVDADKRPSAEVKDVIKLPLTGTADG